MGGGAVHELQVGCLFLHSAQLVVLCEILNHQHAAFLAVVIKALVRDHDNALFFAGNLHKSPLVWEPMGAHHEIGEGVAPFIVARKISGLNILN